MSSVAVRREMMWRKDCEEYQYALVAIWMQYGEGGAYFRSRKVEVSRHYCVGLWSVCSVVYVGATLSTSDRVSSSAPDVEVREK